MHTTSDTTRVNSAVHKPRYPHSTWCSRLRKTTAVEVYPRPTEPRCGRLERFPNQWAMDPSEEDCSTIVKLGLVRLSCFSVSGAIVRCSLYRRATCPSIKEHHRIVNVPPVGIESAHRTEGDRQARRHLRTGHQAGAYPQARSQTERPAQVGTGSGSPWLVLFSERRSGCDHQGQPGGSRSRWRSR